MSTRRKFKQIKRIIRATIPDEQSRERQLRANFPELTRGMDKLRLMSAFEIKKIAVVEGNILTISMDILL